MGDGDYYTRRKRACMCGGVDSYRPTIKFNGLAGTVLIQTKKIHFSRMEDPVEHHFEKYGPEMKQH